MPQARPRQSVAAPGNAEPRHGSWLAAELGLGVPGSGSPIRLRRTIQRADPSLLFFHNQRQPNALAQLNVAGQAVAAELDAQGKGTEFTDLAVDAHFFQEEACAVGCGLITVIERLDRIDRGRLDQRRVVRWRNLNAWARTSSPTRQLESADALALPKLLKNRGGKLDALDVAVDGHVFIRRVEIVLGRAKAAEHGRMGHVDHDRALGADAHDERLLAPDLVGGGNHGLADLLGDRRLVGIGACGVDRDLHVVEAMFLQMGFQFDQLIGRLQIGRAAKVELGRGLGRHDRLHARARVACLQPGDVARGAIVDRLEQLNVVIVGKVSGQAKLARQLSAVKVLQLLLQVVEVILVRR